MLCNTDDDWLLIPLLVTVAIGDLVNAPVELGLLLELNVTVAQGLLECFEVNDTDDVSVPLCVEYIDGDTIDEVVCLELIDEEPEILVDPDTDALPDSEPDELTLGVISEVLDNVDVCVGHKADCVADVVWIAESVANEDCVLLVEIDRVVVAVIVDVLLVEIDPLIVDDSVDVRDWLIDRLCVELVEDVLLWELERELLDDTDLVLLVVILWVLVPLVVDVWDLPDDLE